ncbi:SAF domain-containing protein [Mycobacterium sp. OTB74]|uniref:SAF domain-containing protein n=1 Tax=Mycobacterium sp. OTB74 TaxID=1853452 RepID=UPI0024746FAB|nr:SAF domain-containing protein [Mycobacterium sp. OTB74]MDH6245578.1 Flp pilus assembly protein CpaB [Mycobacterium sp. OTB74]
MEDSLDAPLIGRFLHKLRPDWTRTATARRVAAGALVVLAAVLAFRPQPSDGRVAVVIAKHDLTPGIELAVDDIFLESRSATSVPDGSVTDIQKAVGARLTGPARRGEVITDLRLLGSRLAQSATGPDARIVPLHLADAALPDLLRPGDVVDVLAGPENSAVVQRDAGPEVIATDAAVILVSERAKALGAGTDRIVLVALPRMSATAVAGASLHRQITVTLH